MVGNAPAAAVQLVMRLPGGMRSSVDVHTVALDDSGRVVGSFGVVEVDTAYESPPLLRETLTPRQHQVLVELARGASTEQIATSLGVARETARNHVQGVLRTLQVHSRLEAVAEARRRGLLGP